MRICLAMIILVFTACGHGVNTNVIDEVCLAKSTNFVVGKIKFDDSKNDLKEGEIVSIEGYISLNMEDNAIYPDDSRDHRGYWLDFSKGILEKLSLLKKANGRKVVVLGILNNKKHGHLGSYLGQIDSVFCVKNP